MFTERGYAATSIESIARAANVAVQTIYFTFGTKLALLKELLDVSIAGDEEPVPTLERPWAIAAIASADPVTQIHLQVRAAREISERVAPVLEALRGAATADSEAAELWRTNRAQHLTVQRRLMQALADKNCLRDGLDVATATDIALAVAGAESYHLLVTERGWSPQRWERWAGDLLIQQLVARSTELG